MYRAVSSTKDKTWTVGGRSSLDDIKLTFLQISIGKGESMELKYALVDMI